MTFSFDGVNVWFTGGDWRIVRGTVRVKSLLAAEQRAQRRGLVALGRAVAPRTPTGHA
jgi:hypothetical protein